ncbi:LysR family transcriptional regulator [Ottowia pentelensis]|uniref:LysR family transcriptional regulator n=1 Tax=Ottowia pentelensis TaxID=511108 RepID=A0ABV6PSS8_9BURK
MNVTLRQLSAFVAVARTGSFTEAAAHLHVTQSALSGLIKDLEGALGVQLVHRTTRSVQLSQIGSEFLPLAQRIQDDLERALHSIAELKSLNAGQVRIAAPQLMACTLLPRAVAAFVRQHPKVRVLIVDCEVDEVALRVLSGQVDLGIGPERMPSDELDARLLLDVPFLAVFPPGHALGHQARVSWTDLAHYPLISLQGDYTPMLNSELLSSPGRIELAPAFEVAFMTTALSLVSAGLGVTTCLPYAASLLDLHGLQTRQLTEPVITRRFHVFTRSDRQPGPAAQRFADFLIAYAGEHGWGATD